MKEKHTFNSDEDVVPGKRFYNTVGEPSKKKEKKKDSKGKRQLNIKGE